MFILENQRYNSSEEGLASDGTWPIRGYVVEAPGKAVELHIYAFVTVVLGSMMMGVVLGVVIVQSFYKHKEYMDDETDPSSSTKHRLMGTHPDPDRLMDEELSAPFQQ
jgi:hypothetical protein